MADTEHDRTFDARARQASSFAEEIATIRRISAAVRARADSFVVLLVLNRKPRDGAELAGDYARFSVTSEYMSDEEVRQLADGFAAIGCKVDLSDGEQEFNERLVRGDFDAYEHLNKIVYHSTGSGTGRSRTAFLPALCRLYGLRDSSNDVYTATLLENKVHLFNLLSFYGLPTPRSWFYDPELGWLTGEPRRGMKLIAKPAYECASIGVSEASVSTFCPRFVEHVRALSDAMAQPVIVQEFIEGYEVEVPVFDIGRPFAPMGVGIDFLDLREDMPRANLHADVAPASTFAGDRFLTYDQVYDDRYDFYSFARERPSTEAELRKVAVRSFRMLGLRGMVRVDFRVDARGRAAIIDYNNAPHLTEFHSCARAVKELGFDYADMFCLVLYDHVRAATHLGERPRDARRVKDSAANRRGDARTSLRAGASHRGSRRSVGARPLHRGNPDSAGPRRP